MLSSGSELRGRTWQAVAHINSRGSVAQHIIYNVLFLRWFGGGVGKLTVAKKVAMDSIWHGAAPPCLPRAPYLMPRAVGCVLWAACSVLRAAGNALRAPCTPCSTRVMLIASWALRLAPFMLCGRFGNVHGSVNMAVQPFISSGILF